MTAIVETAHDQTAAYTVTETVLTASDTLTFRTNVAQLLMLSNSTGSNVNVTIDGDGGSTVTIPGLGPVDVSDGKVFAVADGAVVAIPLLAYREYMQGVVAVTGGTGLVARLIALA